MHTNTKSQKFYRLNKSELRMERKQTKCLNPLWFILTIFVSLTVLSIFLILALTIPKKYSSGEKDI